MMQPIRAVLFDLDGTLADTAPDLAEAANTMLRQRGKPTLPESELRRWSSQGACGLIGVAFQVTPENEEFPLLRDEFLNNYANLLTTRTRLFDDVEALLQGIENEGLAWGIVTNKHQRFTVPVVQYLGLAKRAGTIVSGDTTQFAKPHPEPILYAARALKVPPEACVYVGDDERDIVAGRAAGTMTVAAAYGYCGGQTPSTWQAHTIIHKPLELLTWLVQTRGTPG